MVIRLPFLLPLPLLAALAPACGGDDSPGTPDASDVDATHAQIDAAIDAFVGLPDSPICPTGIVPPGLAVTGGEVSDVEDPILVGFQPFAGGDGNGHLLIAVYDRTQVTGATTVDPADFRTAPAYSMIFYRLHGKLEFDMAFATTAGTLAFSRACQTGVAATLTDATFEQVTLADDLPDQVIPGGCSFTVDSLSFDYGTACP